MKLKKNTQHFRHLLEVVTNLKLILHVGHVRLDLRVGVIDDGQEHVEQHEEHEEDVKYEENRAKDAVGRLQLLKVEVTQDDTEQCETEQTNAYIKLIYVPHGTNS
jgi:hypothetical protein